MGGRQFRVVQGGPPRNPLLRLDAEQRQNPLEPRTAAQNRVAREVDGELVADLGDDDSGESELARGNGFDENALLINIDSAGPAAGNSDKRLVSDVAPFLFGRVL